MKLFILFIIYSFIGWFLEVTIVSLNNRKLTSRGFLIGPWCPIYGFGAILIFIMLRKYYEDPVALFVMSFLICSVLEYFTSYIMEKLFKTRWWDYSDKKYNLNGRISLISSLFFGFLGLIITYLLNPAIISLINKIPENILNIIGIILLIIFIIDIIVSVNVIFKLKNIASSKDATIKIHKAMKKYLETKSILIKRLVNAFPNFKIETIKQLKNKKH